MKIKELEGLERSGFSRTREQRPLAILTGVANFGGIRPDPQGRGEYAVGGILDPHQEELPGHNAYEPRAQASKEGGKLSSVEST